MNDNVENGGEWNGAKSNRGEGLRAGGWKKEKESITMFWSVILVLQYYGNV